jgi:aspartate aminotransferase-like enzyme
MTWHKRLFIPGPSEVRPEILLAMATPQIGHRMPEISDLQWGCIKKVQQLLYTQSTIFLMAASSTGAMEAAVRNCTSKKCINFVNGAFAKRWHKMTVGNGIPCDKYEVEFGKAVKPEMVDEKLKTGDYDAMTLVMNETSTGVRVPIEDIADVMKKYPEVMFLVDAVSCMAGDKIEMDKLGIDVLLAGVQKAFALPAGLTVCAVSDKALKKAETVKNRGFYFDFLELMTKYDKGQSPNTPSIAHMFALNAQMDDIIAEGLENRFARHKKMAEKCRAWAKKHFDTFPEKGYESNTLTVITNTKNISVGDLNKELAKHHCAIANGYGDLKDKTFRIAHMGDCTYPDLLGLLAVIDEILGL